MIDPYLYEYRQKEAGMAYVVLLALLAIMATLGLSFAFKVGIETSATETRSDGMQAQYLAEAAANHAMWRLLNESTEDRNIRVEHDNDDSEESDDGSISLGGNKLNLGEERYIGVRFLNVSIPQGATVTNAYITLKACDTDTEHTDITINGENTDDAFPFSANNGDLSGRTKTAAAVNWNDIPNWTDNDYYKTPDLTSIVQEIINRPGWTTGNAMVILFRSEDLNGQRRADTHDSIPGNAPLLYIQFGDSNVAASGVYHMHSLAGGRYGYKIRRHTDTTFATIATVGAVGENVVQQSYVLYVLPGCKPGNFRDEFTTISYSGNNGSEDWSNSWQEQGESDGTGLGRVRVVNTSNSSSSPNALRIGGDEVSIDDRGVSRTADLSDAGFATLSFWYKYQNLDDGGGSINLSVWDDDNSLWVSLDTLNSSNPTGTYSYNITAYISANTQIRFLGSGSEVGSYFYFDDVQIEEDCELTLCDNLVGYWRLDESSGSTIAWNSSGNGNHGWLEDMDPLTDWVSGHLDGALNFDGVDDHIDLSVMNPQNYDDFTISAWYQSSDTSVSDDEYIFAHKKDNAPQDQILFGPTDDAGQTDNLRLLIEIGGAGNRWYYGSSDIVDQQWHHLAAVRDGNRIRLYVDGIEELDTADLDAGVLFTIDASEGPFFGDDPGDTEQVDGNLDEIRIYDRALGPDEIVRLYELTEGGCDPPINNAPFVDAGPDQSLPGPAVKAFLDGMAADDGLPDPPKAVTTNWSQVNGPGTVVFDDASAINTVAVIPAVGIYTLRLTADDGELETFDDLTIELSLPCNGTYGDRFNMSVFNGSSGTLDWSTSPWEEVGESDGPTSGDIRVMSDLGSNRLRLRDNDNGGEGVERQVDLSGAVAAKLIFYYRRDGLDNANDYVKFEISPNGPAGPWTELFRFQGPGTDAAYQMVEVDISAYASSNTRLRFLTSPSMGGTDTVWIDDVYMKCGS